VSGNAEVFGVELVVGAEYTFEGQNGAVFTWYGCELEATGACKMSYVSGETPMVSYVNLHARLETRRAEAKKRRAHGPRVMVVGPTDCGKSSLARILLAYAVRLGGTPTFVDLDIGQGEITVPGNLCATCMDRESLDAVDGYRLGAPLVYPFGHLTPAANPTLFKHLVERLAEKVRGGGRRRWRGERGKRGEKRAERAERERERGRGRGRGRG
jgi:polyribonucleotide 5'-hydroxyl-kinase